MKRKLLILFLMLSIPVFGQELTPKPRPVDPIRVKVSGPPTADDDSINRELSAELVRAFGRLRDVVFVSKRPDFTVQFSAGELGKDPRYGAAVVVVRRKDGNHNLSLYTAATIEQLAAFIVSSVDAEEFEPLRAGAGR